MNGLPEHWRDGVALDVGDLGAGEEAREGHPQVVGEADHAAAPRHDLHQGTVVAVVVHLGRDSIHLINITKILMKNFTTFLSKSCDTRNLKKSVVYQQRYQQSWS